MLGDKISFEGDIVNFMSLVKSMKNELKFITQGKTW